MSNDLLLKDRQVTTEYVIGFVFDGEHVLLRKKSRGPSSVVGKWNGVGGHIEKSEHPDFAMKREFEEECVGPWNVNLEWNSLGTLTGPGYVLYVFSSNSRHIHEMASTDLEEPNSVFSFLPHQVRFVPDLRWMLPLCYVGSRFNIKSDGGY